jgi:chemotaxis protein methyltransferase CheR
MADVTPMDFSFIADLVRARSGIVLGPDKTYLVSSRLLPLARQHGLSSVAALVADMREPSAERLRVAVVEAMTTNETSWYRDVHPFAVFTQHVLPEVMASRRDRRLNIWSAACSTGQEPYTIAMSVLDNPALADWHVSVIASDLSEEVLAKARAGKYTQLETNRGLPAAALVKYFERSGLDWQIKPVVRNLVQFRQLNLGQPLPHMPQLDVVFLRNVLIYFDTEMKQQVLRRIRQALRPGGFLFLGAAETTLGLDESFTRVQYGPVMVYRNDPLGAVEGLGSFAVSR